MKQFYLLYLQEKLKASLVFFKFKILNINYELKIYYGQKTMPPMS